MEQFRQYHTLISELHLAFRKILIFLLILIRPMCHETYGIHHPTGFKFLTGRRLGLNDFNENKFNHNFRNCINSLCSCSLNIGNNVHFFLHCHHFALQR